MIYSKFLLTFFFTSFLFLISAKSQPKTIHVFVALCDNVNQGIVPVPAKLGNGQDVQSNLYWGALYGVKTHFKKSAEWRLLSVEKGVNEVIIERLLFKHVSEEVYLLAEAYDGIAIKQCTIDFLNACAGEGMTEIEHEERNLRFSGCADLLSYVGHDGLMEFSLDQKFDGGQTNEKEAIILACISQSYFAPYLKLTGAYPLIWTSGLMAPEAYTLEWSLNAWVRGANRAEIRNEAAAAYHKYQKCGLKGAKRLLVQGWESNY